MKNIITEFHIDQNEHPQVQMTQETGTAIYWMILGLEKGLKKSSFSESAQVDFAAAEVAAKFLCPAMQLRYEGFCGKKFITNKKVIRGSEFFLNVVKAKVNELLQPKQSDKLLLSAELFE